MEKGIFVEDIRPSEDVKGIFCVGDKRLLETRNGSPYLAVTLQDRSGAIEGRVWERAEQADTLFSRGDYVSIEGDAQLFRDEIQVRVNRIEPVSATEIDPLLFLPVTDADVDELWRELERIVRSVREPAYSTLTREIFHDRRTAQAFRTAPAAKRMHHAELGGLLEHSVSVARLADALCRLYPRLDRDLLVTAALLHDIGKIEEFTFSAPPIDYSDKGRLLGHAVLGISMLERACDRAGIGDSSRKLTVLKHLVLSHHGRREQGAPVLPMTEEAVVLHFLDDLDAKLNYMKRLRGEIKEEEYGWTGYQRLLERYFYLPSGHVGEQRYENPAGKSAGMRSSEAGVMQKRLWLDEEDRDA